MGRFAAALGLIDDPDLLRWIAPSHVKSVTGRPYPLYHGTARGFDQLQIPHEVLPDDAMTEVGLHLGPHQVANMMARTGAEQAARHGEEASPRLYELFARLQNPALLRYGDPFSSRHKSIGWYPSDIAQRVLDSPMMHFPHSRPTYEDLAEVLMREIHGNTAYDARKVVDIFENPGRRYGSWKGFDSIVYPNAVDAITELTRGANIAEPRPGVVAPGNLNYIAFHPNQLRSALTGELLG